MDILKFHAVIRPNTRVRVELIWHADLHALGFRLSSDAGHHASGKIVFHRGAP